MRLWAMHITYCDHRNNRFLCLGRADFKTKRERDENLSHIPTSPQDTEFLLDVVSARGIENDLFIDSEVVERLMGEKVPALIERAGAAEDEREKAERERGK